MYPYASTEFLGGSPGHSCREAGPPTWYGEGMFPPPSPSMPSCLVSPSPSPLLPVFSSPSPPWPTFTPSLTPSPNPTEPFPYPTSPCPMIVPSPPLPFASAVPYPIVPPLPPMRDADKMRSDVESHRPQGWESHQQRRRKADKGRDKSRRRRKSPPSAKKHFGQLPTRRQLRDSDATPSSTSIGKLLAELAALDGGASASTAMEPPLPRSVRPLPLLLPRNGLSSLNGASFFRVPRTRRPRAEDDLDDGDWDVCALNACVPVVLIVTCVLLILLGTANRLLHMVSNEFPIAGDRAVHRPAVGQGSSGSGASARAVEVPAVAGPPPTSASSVKPRGDCATDSCLWEGQYLFGKIDNRIPPCQDFYAHVCSDNWFKDARNFNSHPFAYRASSAVMLDLWKLLQRQSVNESTFTSHAALILRRCVPEPSNDAPDWSVLRKIFADLSIAEWPYVDTLPNTDIHSVAMVADKMLGLSTVVSMRLKERPADHEIVLHLDSPPILLRRHEDVFPGEDPKTYEAFVARVLSLLKPARSYTRNLVLELVRLEQRLSDAAAHSVRSVPVLHVVRPIMQVRSYSHWNWNVYFSYFLQGNEGRHSNAKIVLLDAVYFERLSSILSQASSRLLANYIGYKLLVHLSPLLPSKAAEFMIPLSHQHNSAGGVPARIEACMYLVERLYPYGTRVLVWHSVLHKIPGLVAGKLIDDLHQLEEFARFEMRQSAATAPWLTQDEADVAVLKMDRLQTVLVPAYRDLELQYPLLDQPTVRLSSNQYVPVLETYYNLVRTLRAQYWSTPNLTWFQEPLLPSESAFKAAFSYDPSLNRLSMSPATVAFVAGISRNPDHNVVPFFLGQLLRGMFSVMDVRGSTVDADGEFLGWWSSTSEDRFLGRARCLQGGFGAAARHFVQDDLAASVFLEENVMDGAVLRPLYNVFSRVVKQRADASAAIAGQPRELTLRQLFFVNWASTLCEPPATHAADAVRRRLRYKIGVPARMRVNVALSRFLPFAEAFSCPPGSRMNPVRSCSFW
ncbi:neprilysin-21-like [Dermacentor albipictus]|uniref:neprilysin-21-like n=1 Tax=Dermacentor albipictus TaxID=60249 RepID=UPI0031FDA191